MSGSVVWQIVGWLALVLNVWGNLALASKGSVGWIVRLASNACWIGYSLDTHAWALLANHLLFSVINVYGWRRWKKETGLPCKHPFCEVCTTQAITKTVSK